MKSLPLAREGLSKGDFQFMRTIAKENPITFAELLQDPSIFKEIIKATEATNMKWSAAQFLHGVQKDLTEEQKRIARGVLIRLLMQLASRISARGIRSTERVLTTFQPGLEEMEIEETLDNVIGKKCPDYDDIIMVDKRPKRRGVVLMLDVSNSMQREKILIATLAIGVLAYRLRGEHYAVITFNNEVEIIKPIEKEMPIEALLDRMLEIQPKGITNIKLALEDGLEQLSKQVVHEKIGIIATDGWTTTGGDPIEVAKNYARLHVIQVPMGIGGGDDNTCIAMANVSKGKRIYVKHFMELPRAVLEILR